jgi:hypothetical protein
LECRARRLIGSSKARGRCRRGLARLRGLLLLTATPHSGDEAAFDRLLGLIHPDFAAGPTGADENSRTRYARRLAQHFVQRRRADITEGGWDERRTFPKHNVEDEGFTLVGDFLQFQEDALDYCMAVTERAGDRRIDEARAACSRGPGQPILPCSRARYPRTACAATHKTRQGAKVAPTSHLNRTRFTGRAMIVTVTRCHVFRHNSGSLPG